MRYAACVFGLLLVSYMTLARPGGPELFFVRRKLN